MLSSTETPAKKMNHAASERRVTAIALQYWYSLRGPRECASKSGLVDSPRPTLVPHLFIVTPNGSPDSFHFSSAGEVLANLCRTDPVGRVVGETLPRLFRDRAQSLISTAFQIRKPLADCGRLHEARGTDMLYRSVYMPLADAEGRFESLLGAISFKRQIAA
jgi:hypothetical protein